MNAAPPTDDRLDRLPTGHATLSEPARRRKAAMLPELAGAVRRRGRNRRMGHAAGAGALLLIVLGATLWAGWPAPGPGPDLAGSPESRPPPLAPEAPPGVEPAPAVRSRLVAYVATDPAATDRLRASPRVGGVEILSDAELVEALGEAGIRAGLVRTDRRTSLAFREPPPELP